MLALLMATLLSASFNLIVRHAQGRGQNVWAVGATNYLTAALLHVARWALSGAVLPPLPVLALGVAGGLAFSGTYLILLPAMRRRGVSVSTAMARLSVVVPIVAAIALWGERPSPPQIVGGLLALASLPLLSLMPGERGPRQSWSGALLLIALFLGNGLCMLAVRGYEQLGASADSSGFLMMLFGSAAVVIIGVWLSQRDGPLWPSLPSGIALGLCNGLSNLALIAALGVLPSLLVFPVQSALGLILVALAARLIWDERISRLEWGGMALALAAVAVVNLG